MDDEEKVLTDNEVEALQKEQEEFEEDQRDERLDEQQDDNLEFQEGYGPPPPEKVFNQHTFLHDAAFETPNTLRVTNLEPEELGRPIFNVRFLLDMEDIAKFYLDEICKEIGIDNKIADYFRQKIINITDSGMSKGGFTMLLNTTRNVNVTRTRKKQRIENLKGGRKNVT